MMAYSARGPRCYLATSLPHLSDNKVYPGQAGYAVPSAYFDSVLATHWEGLRYLYSKARRQIRCLALLFHAKQHVS